MFSKAIISALLVITVFVGVVSASASPSALFAGRSGSGSVQHGGSVLNIVSNLGTGIAPILAGITNAAFVGDAAGAGSALGRLTTLISSATTNLRSLPSSGVPTGNALPVVNEVVSIMMAVLGALVTLGGLGNIDHALSSFLNALNGAIPGISRSVGSKIQNGMASSLSVLGLSNTASLLGIGGGSSSGA